MESRMVNSSSSFDERNGNPILSSPLTANSAFLGDHGPRLKTTLVPKPSEANLSDLTAIDCNGPTPEAKTTLFCSFPLEKVQTILAQCGLSSNCGKTKGPRKILCLYCDRSFVNVNLRQKHVERCHSAKHLRRASLRKHQNILTSTPCIFCDQFTSTEHTLKDLFRHLVEKHSNKYFGCVNCEIRFLNSSHLGDHRLVCPSATVASDRQDPLATLPESSKRSESDDGVPVKTLRKKQRTRKEDKLPANDAPQGTEDQRKACDVKNLRSKKLSVKSSRMILKRSKRLQAKLTENVKKKRTRDLNEKKKSDRLETFTKLNDKSTKAASTFVNPYPEFDHFFQVKKITDHSIDNLKISSLTFDDVFDKAFFNRIRCNIQENLMHHIDGKLFKNEESESRISNFEKNANIPQETQNLNSENYGCELSLNAIAPTTMLLSNQLGDDPESQIEYGSKPSKKKTQLKKDEVHYKYFTRRKYQASILEHKENRDLSKLDMWTQYVIKRRQQKIQDDKRTPKEILDYFAGEEYKNTLRREELNRILDRRGPFEDLKEEVSKKAALDKLNGENVLTGDDNLTEIGELLNDILNRVFELAAESSTPLPARSGHHAEDALSEIPSYLNLRPSTDVVPENEIDKSDKIALICSSQETENFELPSNTVRGKNEKVELTGEWARSRIYVCAACGLKLQNIKQFLEHKSATHQYIWVQHYEFVGNQSELYRHLSIPVLGKVGVLENVVQCKVWRRSDARLCTKCGKQCNSLGELHRHILECGGDWTWMLARKKCKYRPFGAKSRRKRKGLVKRIYAQKSDVVPPTEKKIYKKPYDKPSDAETIKRMLANLPPKRATRKIISLKDGINAPRTRQVQSAKKPKFKCGKMVRQKQKEQNPVVKNGQKKHGGNYRRSLRCLSKVLTSRILDTKSTIMVRRKYTRKIKNEQAKEAEDGVAASPKKIARAKKPTEPKITRSSPRLEKEKHADAKITIKQFFPVKKKRKNAALAEVKDSPKTEEVVEEKIVPEVEKEIENQESPSGVNLRKRKGDQTGDSDVAKKAKVKKTRKRRRKRAATESNPEPPKDERPEIGDFFGEAAREEAADVQPNPVVEEKVEETVVLAEKSDPEKVVTTSGGVVTESLPSPTKRKIKKPARGLNDCIAMLTSKLGKSFEESATDIFSNVVMPSDTKYLLKVPFSNEHFHLRINEDETGISDGCSQNNSKLPESSPAIGKDKEEEVATIVEEKLVGNVCEEATVVEENDREEATVVEERDIGNDCLEDKEEVVDWEDPIVLQAISEDDKINSDSEDEIPLATFLSVSSKTEEEMQDAMTAASPKDDVDAQMALSAEIEADQINIEEAKNVPEAQNEEKSDVKITKKKDVAVLTEINANLCEHAENQIENANRLENRRILETKVDDSVLANSDLLLQRDGDENLNSINDARDLSSLASLEQQILSKLDKFNFFTKTSFEPDTTSSVTIHEHLSAADPNVDEVKSEADTSEYKENVIRKHKQRKKSAVNRTTSKSKGENHRRQASSEGVSDKKGLRSDKISEFLAEFAESEREVGQAEFSDEVGQAEFTENEREVGEAPQIGVVKETDLVFEKEDSLHLSREKQIELDDGSTCEEVAENQTLSQLIEMSDDTAKLAENATENVRELRRSSRNAKRITSYNETDLIDPLLDDIDSDRTISRIIRETTKDIFGFKRKSRKLLTQRKAKNGHIDRKLNGEELFDLLKATPNENIVLSKPATYFNTFDEISNEFNDDNFDVFEDILEKSIAVIDESLSQPILTADEIIKDAPSVPTGEECPKLNQENKKKVSKKKTKRNRSKQKSEMFNEESRLGDIDHASVDDSDANTKDTSDKTRTVYCEICDKSFSRMESLTKHKRTLTHISKLSELEAKEAALKTQCDPKSTNEENEITPTVSGCEKDLNLLGMLGDVDEEEEEEEEECKECPSSFEVTVRNSNLKLADIINDVLNKPLSKKDEDVPIFAEVMTQQNEEAQVEVRRCKSLAERKSFESENFKSDYFSPEIANGAAGTILEKQITLLENIIENRTPIGYIDDITVSSSPSLDKNSSECNSKQAVIDPKEAKAGNESFLKPSQYEEISEDSNLRNYDEQKSRKALNRDEELFLECCSLLKSGSEVSSYSKKSNNISKDANKPCDESDWLETNYLSQQGNSDFAECYSDGSRIRTPLGDGFSQDSDSATLSSQWNMNSSCTPTKKQIWKEDLKLKNKNLTFEEVFCTKDDDNNLEDLHSMVSSFDRVISEVLNTELHPSEENSMKRCVSSIEELPRESYESERKESTSADGRKVLTKGAMKIFEGLKVSIPTEDLNIDTILISGSAKTSNFNDSDLNSLTGEEVPVKPANRQSKKSTKSLLKSAIFKKQNDQQSSGKGQVHDVYDFEETQDNSDVFTKPDFRSFRNSSEKSRKTEQDGSEDDSQDCTDPFSFDAMSSSTSSVSEVLPAKPRDQQNLTKKKCMIMGRIFKNVVVKSKVEDEDLRNILIIDNKKLVEDFVLNCPQPETTTTTTTAVVKKPRMTEEELNLEFDKLLTKPNSAAKNGSKGNAKRRQKVRNKKRCNSDSSGDEFKLQKHPVKRTKKKSASAEKDGCINLEQELRECIGVASRKSQRKCTSGKQNVLIEYWSSDESSFEALLEKQIVNSVQQNHREERVAESVPECAAKEPIVDEVKKSPPREAVAKKQGSRANRRKRVAANPLYHWSSSSEDESRDLIEVRPLRDEAEDEDRPIQHGWIVGDSPKKLVTMLAQAKGKKIDIDSVKEHGRKRPSVCS